MSYSHLGPHKVSLEGCCGGTGFSGWGWILCERQVIMASKLAHIMQGLCQVLVLLLKGFQLDKSYWV